MAQTLLTLFGWIHRYFAVSSDLMSHITLRLQSCSHQWFTNTFNSHRFLFYNTVVKAVKCHILRWLSSSFLELILDPREKCFIASVLSFNSQSSGSSLVKMGAITRVTKTLCLHSTLTYFKMKSLFANTAISPTNTFMSCSLSKQPFSGQWHEWVIEYNNISEEFASHRLSCDSI